MNDMPESRSWPEGVLHRVPTWIYTDPELFAREMERFFFGPTWHFIGLDCEVPEPGSYKRAWIATRQVLLTRDLQGEIHVLENRCAHRAAPVCWKTAGTARTLACPYHQWTYALDGTLQGVPFMRGTNGKGGMPRDFDRSQHRMRQLRVARRGGSVWASFAMDGPDFETFCGETMLARLDRVFARKKLRLIGTERQLLANNWKMYAENLRDPYHATSLHAFFTVFGLFRPDVPLISDSDAEGKHILSHSVYGAANASRSNEVAAATASLARKIELEDPGLVRPIDEFGDATLASVMLFPSCYVQQHANMLAVRLLVPRSVDECELSWTQFGYEDDDDAMRLARMKHSNLVGASGMISLEDGDALAQTQAGVTGYPHGQQVIEMGGRGVALPFDNMVQEDLIRSFYRYYRAAMGI